MDDIACKYICTQKHMMQAYSAWHTHTNNDSHKATQPTIYLPSGKQLFLWRKIIQSGWQIRLGWIKHSTGDFSTLNTKNNQPASSHRLIILIHKALFKPLHSLLFSVFISGFVQLCTVAHLSESTYCHSFEQRDKRQWRRAWVRSTENEQTLYSQCGSSGPLHRHPATSVRRWQDLIFLSELDTLLRVQMAFLSDHF